MKPISRKWATAWVAQDYPSSFVKDKKKLTTWMHNSACTYNVKKAVQTKRITRITYKRAHCSRVDLLRNGETTHVNGQIGEVLLRDPESRVWREGSLLLRGGGRWLLAQGLERRIRAPVAFLFWWGEKWKSVSRRTLFLEGLFFPIFWPLSCQGPFASKLWKTERRAWSFLTETNMISYFVKYKRSEDA